VRLSSTVATSEVTNHTASAVAIAQRSGPWTSVIDHRAMPTMAEAKKSAQRPPFTEMDRAVLCAVSMGARPAAETNEPAPVPKNGA